jgi:two-component system phosphate regulon response regulator PhoB
LDVNKLRILVVEDEPAVAELLRVGLEAEGFEVLKAEDGLECLKKIRSQKPSLVILDVMLPRIDGFKVCRLLKFDKSTQDIPIILCSARSSDADRERGRHAGADHYVVKPFEKEDLLAIIKHLVSQCVCTKGSVAD